MKLSKQYILGRLEETSVHDLAVEIATEQLAGYKTPTGYSVDFTATVAKYETMMKPLAPIKATDAMRALGVTVVEVK
jgi:hypothetical protein